MIKCVNTSGIRQFRGKWPIRGCSDSDPYHFAMLDKDYDGNSDSGTDHATFRQYSDTQGRWMSPDPYSGSYEPSNPQSFNRYAYVLNDPLAFTDPSGLITNGEYCGNDCPNNGDGGGIVSIIAALGGFFGHLFGAGGPSFHGSMKPRPNYQPWDEYHIHYGPDIADALGLPDEQCDFGVCGAGPASSLTPGQASALAAPIRVSSTWVLSIVNLFHFPYADVSDPNHRLYGTHYCGPSGGGVPTGGLDQLCAAHDACYRANGVSAIDNLNPFTSGSAMGGCDRLLCTELSHYTPKNKREAVGKGQIQWAFGCGYINK